MKKWNAKVKCISACGLATTEGKIYDIIDGRIIFNSGSQSTVFNSIEELNQTLYSKFELVKENKNSIHIYENNKIITAVLKENGKVIKTAMAKCSPKDEYEFNIGAKIALDRLIEKDVKVDNLEGYKPIEKKEEFKPHLEFLFGKEHYGTIGEETNIIDVLGNKMKVGDTVILYGNTKVLKVTTVCKNEIFGSFVMGVASSKFVDGKSKDNNFVWTIIKEKSYEEIDNGIIISNVKYVKEK